MAQPLDYVEYLSKEIGARPAGTEEEQQAALYIADQFQEEAGFPATIEEFTSSSNLEGGRAILSMITIVVSILAMLFNILTAPAFVLAVIAAVIYVLESYDHPVISSKLARGASQNVVAKYQPSQSQEQVKRGARQRKIVLVAHYDTGKVTPGVIRRIEAMNLPISQVCLVGMVAAAFFLLLRFFLGGTGGAGLVFINLLTIIAVIIVALPIIKAILYRVAPYNEGANNNATGVAALIEVARRINSGSLSEADLQEEGFEAVIHGEQAAREAGLVPEGADVRYDVDITEDDADLSEEERLLSAKAAIAALTGRPVDQRIFGNPSTERPERVQEPDQGVEPVYWDEAAGVESDVYVDQEEFASPVASVVAAPVVEEEVDTGFENAPSWFVAAQRNAKRSETEQPVQRSRYTEAIQAAERELAAREQAREDDERARREEELRAREEAARAAFALAEEAAASTAGDVAVEAEVAAAPVVASLEVPEVLATPAIPEEAAPVVDPQSTTEFQPIAWGQDEVVWDSTEKDAPLAEAELPQEEEQEAVDLAAAVPAVLKVPEVPMIDEEPVDEPGRFEDRLDAPVDLGQTIAYSPAMIREAIQEELMAETDDAELADAEESRPDSAARQLLVELPQVDGDAPSDTVPEQDNPSRSGLFRMLRSDIPSLSGAIPKIDEEQANRDALLKSAQLPKITLEGGVAAPVVEPEAEDEAEVQAEAVTEEALENVPEAVKADDLGEFAAPAQVEMPKSRFSRKGRKNAAKLEDKPQEWLDVDENFEAREAGRERGSWESFRDDESAAGENGKGRSWQGGAFSRLRLGHVSTRSGEAEEEAEVETQEVIESVEDQALNEEIEQIYHFRNPEFSSEIWFVAIGSDTELHDGARAFAEEHKSELRGAMIIELESLGVGELCFASEEGRFKKMQASSRIKRFARGATEATGIMPGQIRLSADSITTVIQKAGMQAMHLMGVEEGLPALKGSADDILENVDEMLLEENINYVMELLKQD